MKIRIAVCVGRVGLSVVLLASCARKDAPDRPTDAQQPEPDHAEPQPKALSALFEGTAPATPPPVFGDFKLDTVPPAAAAGAPDLVAVPTPLRDYPQARAQALLTASAVKPRRVRMLVLELDQGGARQAIVEAWGEGEVLANDSKKSRWFNPQLGVRAQLVGDSRLELDSFMPLPKFIGDEPGLPFGFEKQPLLGAAPAELTSYAIFAALPGSSSRTIEVAPPEWSEFDLVVLDIGGVGGRVREYVFRISYAAHPAWKETIRALLVTKLGEPSMSKDANGKAVLHFTVPGARVRAFDDEHSWSVDVTAAP